MGELFPFELQKHDFNGDDKLQFEEMYDAASAACYTQLESINLDYLDKYGSVSGAQVAKATEKIGFAKEKLGQPSAMLTLYFDDILKFGNDPTNLGVDDILKNTAKNISSMKIDLVKRSKFLRSFKTHRTPSLFLSLTGKVLSKKFPVRWKNYFRPK